MAPKLPNGIPRGPVPQESASGPTDTGQASQTLKEPLIVGGNQLPETTAPEGLPIREALPFPPKPSPPTQPWGDGPPGNTNPAARPPPLAEAPSGLTGTVPSVRTVADPASLEEGRTVGRYRLVSRLGRGGMAETWKAQLLAAAGVTRPAVIKRILPHLAQNPVFTEAFINEARVSATLSHGNIVQIFDFGEASGEYFIAMEYVQGRTLQAVLDRASRRGFGHLPPQVACFIAAEVLEGLHYAHTRVGADGKPLNIVHRDVSPDNVMLGFDGQTKLLDFGVAKARLEGRAETAPGMFKGKWTFFSPEQAEARPLDGRSDLFAVGIWLYLMLTGRLPFDGDPAEALQSIVIGRFRPASARNPQLSPELNSLVNCALEPLLSKRFSSAAEMEGALRKALMKAAPDFTAATLKAFLLWLFEEELEGEGIADRPTPGQRQAFERWAQETNPACQTDPARAATAPVTVAPVTEQAELPKAPSKRPLLLAVVAALGAALAAAWWFG